VNEVIPVLVLVQIQLLTSLQERVVDDNASRNQIRRPLRVHRGHDLRRRAAPRSTREPRERRSQRPNTHQYAGDRSPAPACRHDAWVRRRRARAIALPVAATANFRFRRSHMVASRTQRAPGRFDWVHNTYMSRVGTRSTHQMPCGRQGSNEMSREGRHCRGGTLAPEDNTCRPRCHQCSGGIRSRHS
jgi:hypothetical protein